MCSDNIKENVQGFCGRIEDFPTTTVLQVLELGKKSGFLYIRHFPKVAFLVLRDGAIVQAVSSLKRAGLGEWLLSEGLIKQEDLTRVLSVQRSSPTRRMLGKLFVELGYVTRDQVNAALVKQMKEVVRWVLKWKEGDFTFYPEERDSGQWESAAEEGLVLPVGVVVQEVLQEAMEDHERRKYPRVPVSLKVTSKIEGKERTWYTRDVSGGGLFILSDFIPKVNDKVEIFLWIPSLFEPSRCSARVVRTVESGPDRGFAVEFVDIDAEARGVLEQLGRALDNLFM